jgi:hypothetical protein
VKTERNVRQVEGAGDTIPEQANVYVPPRPLAALSEHRTMDVKAIRLAAEVDPRQALTELRLSAPPLKKDNTWVAPLLLALLAIGFIGLWWLTPSPLPLATTRTAEQEPPASPVAAPLPVKTVPAPPPLTAELPRSLPVMPSSPAAPRTASAPPNAARVPASPNAPALPSATHRPKQGRDPWLE